MLTLRFIVYSIFYGNETEKRKCVEYNVTKEYDESKTLKEVLKELYFEYEPHNGKYNDDWENRCDVFNINELFWKQYFSNEIVSKIDYTFSDYKKMTIGVLNKQFNICNMVIPVVLNKDKGASVGYCEGIDFFFHPREDNHNNPHIHCKYSGKTISIDLNTLKVLNGSFKKSKIAFAIEKIKNNQTDLLMYWEKFVKKGEPIKFKMRF